MKVFLSWSGDLSRELAEALRDWLPAVLQSIKPFFTPNDIEKGARWNKDISQELEESSFGIFCLTRENLAKPWIMFEAGALSKRIDSSRVCPVLFGVDSADLEGPLVQFQASPFSEAEVRKLMKTLNSGLGEARLEDSVLSSVFEMWWPRLNDKVTKVLEKHARNPAATTSSRTDRDILEEVLQLTRLSTANRPKIIKTPDYVDPAAFLHSLRHVLTLCEQVKSGEYLSMMLVIKEIYEPLRYIGEQLHMPPRYEKEASEISLRIRELIGEEI